MPRTRCYWYVLADTDDDSQVWQPSCSTGLDECGRLRPERFHNFNAGGPQTNGFKFCPYCAGKLTITQCEPNIINYLFATNWRETRTVRTGDEIREVYEKRDKEQKMFERRRFEGWNESLMIRGMINANPVVATLLLGKESHCE